MKMRVVSVTPAGRSRYIDILSRYLLKNRESIDEHHFWLNTDNEEDLRAIGKWCESNPEFFKAVKPDFPPPRTAKTIHHFYKDYCDEDTVYLRFDDDICWINDDCVQKLLDYRLNNRHLFLAYANVVNHTTCDRFHQASGCCPLGIQFYFNGEHAKRVHKEFIKNMRQGTLDRFFFLNYEVSDYERVSTNIISWFGEDLGEIDGNVVGNEEQFLAVDYPRMSGRTNGICGSALACHFAYGPQRRYLEQMTNLLEIYDKISRSSIVHPKFF